jgi:hypothetical protein
MYIWTKHYITYSCKFHRVTYFGPKGKDFLLDHLKRLSHEIFRPAFWPLWMHLHLNMNHVCFKNCYDAHSIFGGYLKFLCVSYQTFSEILRISKKDWQLNSWFSNNQRHAYIVEEHSRRTAELVVNYSRRSYKSLRSIDTFAAFLRGPQTQKKENWRTGLSCQSFLEILWITEEVWIETHQYLT